MVECPSLQGQAVFFNCLTLKKKVSQFFKTSGTTHPLTHHHIMKDLNPQQDCSENLTSPDKFMCNDCCYFYQTIYTWMK
jgi:hypothetical protein